MQLRNVRTTTSQNRHTEASSLQKNPGLRAGIDDLLVEATARDFVADAFAHCKFIAYVEATKPLFAKAGIDVLDEGVVALAAKKDIAGFVAKLSDLRLWAREPKVKMP